MTDMSHLATPIPGARQRERTRPAVTDLFRISLWLGLVGFGGGLSVLSAIRSIVVERHAWLTEREFANTATVAQMLPGGAAANALAYVGLRFRGATGALAAYVGFVLPGAVAALALAIAYVRVGGVPSAGLVLGGLTAGIVGIVAAITIQMARTGIGRLWQMAVAAGALLFSLAGGASSGEIAIIGIGVGLVIDLGTKRARLARVRRRQPSAPIALPDEGEPLPSREGKEDREGNRAELPALLVAVGILGMHLTGVDGELLRVALVFFRTGLGAYGGGFAIIPHLRQALETNGWLTDRQFADAVAIGKLTPGPVLLMATFIGYLVGGLSAALVATASIFAAPFVLVVVLGGWLDRVRSRRTVRAALRGLTPAVVGLMAAATLTLGRSLANAPDLAIAAAVTLTLARFRVNPVLMLALAGAARVGLRAAGV